MKGAIVGVGLTGGGKNGVEKVFGRGVVEEGVGKGLIFDCGGTGQAAGCTETECVLSTDGLTVLREERL